MLSKLTSTTATTPAGLPTERKLFRVRTGVYAGRLLAILQTASGDLKYGYADRPYTAWSTMTTIASDADDNPFDAVMQDNGDIHLVYTEVTTQNLVFRKMTLTNGIWSIGSKVTVYNGNKSFSPSIGRESSGKLWVSWTVDVTGTKTIHVKSSTDNGVTWGSGPADGGDSLTGGTSLAWSRLILTDNDIYVAYTDGGTELSIKSQPLSTGPWSSEYTLSTGTGFDQHFDLALSEDGRLGVVWDNSVLYFREYNGLKWSGVLTIDSSGGDWPQLIYSQNVPIILFLSTFGTGQTELKFSTRETGSFSTPAPLDQRSDTFDSVMLYSSNSSTYEDLTTEASNSSSADIYHSGTGSLLKDVGDNLYLGMSDRFRYVKFLLSTAGIGGSVSYSYYDGSGWIGFTPAGSVYHLSASDRDLLLWDDYKSIASDWQQTSVNGTTKFWIRITVDTVFTTAPIGTQLTAVSDLKSVLVRR